ncbi:MAG: serine hydrolase [Patescibacteria group bacterium]
MPRRIKAAILAALYVGVIIGIIYLTNSESESQSSETADDSYVPDEHFANLMLEAKAVYVWDVEQDRVLFEKNEHTPLPIASITKVMTSLCALDSLGRDGVVTIETGDKSKADIDTLVIGEKWKVADLISYMLVESSNSAANALARTAGGAPNTILCMNNRAEKMELFETRFGNVTGLDVASSSGAYASAENVARMFKASRDEYQDIFEHTADKSYTVSSLSDISHTAINTDRAIGSIPGLVASKTGLTDIAGGNLVFEIMRGQGRRAIVVILGSSEEGRFSDAIKLGNAINNT